ncbi:hypothetical protein GCM10007939_00590 [Amylibacter marinus]|uniref:Uncharacterized protein n=1 Tax=Amylibacter marinus TaxID=1475483 RepID=A0ABQ5VR82_9RHOB|nr:hypothetical protein [Amylibacter marinus]GLQ33776.1 hypothetical protein GCM10007939_00590 [Amylibacter marinus]
MSDQALGVEEIEALYTTEQGYRFARWGRPIAPVIFGVDDQTLSHLKAAITTTVGITGGSIAETDPELGANFMWFFCQSWDEILAVPDLDRMIPNLGEIIPQLKARNANRYRSFAFDAEGGIKMCIVLVRLSEADADIPAHVLATGETFQCLTLFQSNAFADHSPIAVLKENGLCLAKPNYAALVRAAYDPVMPIAADDPSHALRLAARAGMLFADMHQEGAQ